MSIEMYPEESADPTAGVCCRDLLEASDAHDLAYRDQKSRHVVVSSLMVIEKTVPNSGILLHVMVDPSCA